MVVFPHFSSSICPNPRVCGCPRSVGALSAVHVPPQDVTWALYPLPPHRCVTDPGPTPTVLCPFWGEESLPCAHAACAPPPPNFATCATLDIRPLACAAGVGPSDRIKLVRLGDGGGL